MEAWLAVLLLVTNGLTSITTCNAIPRHFITIKPRYIQFIDLENQSKPCE